MNERRYPIGIQNFEKLRKEGFLYVDKTELVYRLVKTGTYYFLSRPRRFGKSLLVSTLEAYFQGKKELFAGLALERLEKDWAEHPVLHLDLNTQQYNTTESLSTKLNRELVEWEKLYGAEAAEVSLSMRFEGVIRRACERTGQRVAILVDEYDKPMLQAIGNKELQQAFRDILKAFYGALKSMDKYIKFAFLTGVTKFGKVSVFSDLNNLLDISMDEAYTGICGITEGELTTYFKEDIHDLAVAQGMTDGETFARLKENYDGYHFVPHTEGIYNPFSLLNTFYKRKFGSYWFETGTPTYLVELLQRTSYDLERLPCEETSDEVLNSIYDDDMPIPVIYQSGYLTIKDYDEEFGIYTLGFPNREVAEGFMRFLMPFYTKVNKTNSAFEIKRFVQEIQAGDPDAFLKRLRSFFSGTPYELVGEQELYYQNVLFIVFRLVGFHVQAEFHTSEGRVDLVLQTDKYVYVMEFKLDGTAEEAMQQINDRHYARPFEADGRRVFKVGVNFSKATRTIDSWIIG